MSVSGSKTRNRQRPMKVYVSDEERQKIEAFAEDCKLSPTAYLRNLGLGCEPKSAFDRDVIHELAKLHAEQEQLRGLLKQWLAEKSGAGAPVESLLEQIESLQMAIVRLMMEAAKRL